MPPISSVASARASLAVSARWHKPGSAERKRDLEVSKLAAHIAAVVSAAPAPTDEQISELCVLLSPSMTASAKGATADNSKPVALTTPHSVVKVDGEDA